MVHGPHPGTTTSVEVLPVSPSSCLEQLRIDSVIQVNELHDIHLLLGPVLSIHSILLALKASGAMGLRQLRGSRHKSGCCVISVISIHVVLQVRPTGEPSRTSESRARNRTALEVSNSRDLVQEAVRLLRSRDQLRGLVQWALEAQVDVESVLLSSDFSGERVSTTLLLPVPALCAGELAGVNLAADEPQTIVSTAVVTPHIAALHKALFAALKITRNCLAVLNRLAQVIDVDMLLELVLAGEGHSVTTEHAVNVFVANVLLQEDLGGEAHL